MPKSTIHHAAGSRIGVLLLLAAAGSAGMSGCVSEKVEAVEVTPAQFRSSPTAIFTPPPVSETVKPAPTAPTAALAQDAPVVALEAKAVSASGARAVPIASNAQAPAELAGKINVMAGSPQVLAAGSAANPRPLGPSVLAEAMVGQINGRPVFANEILTPLDGELRARAEEIKDETGARRWLSLAVQRIRQRVESRVQDELLLAEARARLSPEERAGLLNFLNTLRDAVTARAGGSEAQAEREIVRETGEANLDEFLKVERDKALARRLADQAIEPNVRVSWRKVERTHEEMAAESANRGPTATVRIVVVNARDEELVELVRNASKDTLRFEAVARSEANAYKRESAGIESRPLDKPFEQVTFSGSAALQAAISKLQAGQATDPIQLSPRSPFVAIARREADFKPTVADLEEAQIEIRTQLTSSKRREETQEFFRQVLGRGSFTPMDRMSQELVLLAADRYLLETYASRVRSTNPLKPLETDLERAPAPPTGDEVLRQLEERSK
jgi:hypothetical protein